MHLSQVHQQSSNNQGVHLSQVHQYNNLEVHQQSNNTHKAKKRASWLVHLRQVHPLGKQLHPLRKQQYPLRKQQHPLTNKNAKD